MRQENYEILKHFYKAVQRKDTHEMLSTYADDVEFSDPAFGNLQGQETEAMWRMRLGHDDDSFKVNFCDIEANENGGKVTWEAEYTYKNNPVFNRIESYIEIKNGKIIKQEDKFSLQRWASMALGAKGIVLGLTPFLKSQVRKINRKSLKNYMNQNY